MKVTVSKRESLIRYWDYVGWCAQGAAGTSPHTTSYGQLIVQENEVLDYCEMLG